MSIEKRIKNKLKKVEECRDNLASLQQKRTELEEALHTLDHLEENIKKDIIEVEDYFVKHKSSIRVETIEVIKDVKIDVLIAHQGTSTFAIFGGLITSAKTHPEDNYIPELGEAIAIQKLVNQIFEINYGVKF